MQSRKLAIKVRHYLPPCIPLGAVKAPLMDVCKLDVKNTQANYVNLFVWTKEDISKPSEQNVTRKGDSARLMLG